MYRSLLVVVMLVDFFVAFVPDQSALAEDDGEIIGFAPGPQRDDIAPGEFIGRRQVCIQFGRRGTEIRNCTLDSSLTTSDDTHQGNAATLISEKTVLIMM